MTDAEKQFRGGNIAGGGDREGGGGVERIISDANLAHRISDRSSFLLHGPGTPHSNMVSVTVTN